MRLTIAASPRLTVAALALALAVPVNAQFSDAYKFLEAVRDKDAATAKQLGSRPGGTIAQSRDPATGESALHIVVRRRDLAWIDFLLSMGLDVDARDNRATTPLLLAAELGFTDGARQLILRRANVNAANASGETALIKAVQLRNAEMVRLLVDNGANPDHVDSVAGFSARDYAARDRRSAGLLRIIEDSQQPAKAAAAGPTP